MNDAPTLETPRLLMRPHRLDDYEACCFLATDTESLHLIPHKPLNREQTWHRLLGMLGHWAIFGYGLLLIQERATGRVVGEVGFASSMRGLGPDFDPWPELSWMVTSDAQGHGYATEAGLAMQHWMDERFAPDRTVCMIDPDYTAARHTAEKLGFHSFGKDRYNGRAVLKLRRIPVRG